MDVRWLHYTKPFLDLLRNSVMTASSTLSLSRTFDSCSVMHALCAHAGVPSPFALRVFLYCGFALYSRIAAFDQFYQSIANQGRLSISSTISNLRGVSVSLGANGSTIILQVGFST